MSGERVIKLKTPLIPQAIADLHVGDTVLLSGIIHTARDAAHKRML
ncbi:MAG: fumarate hydratase C-terminal domain-containing protein, partial [bacterium]